MNGTSKATALNNSIANINGTVKVSNVFIFITTPYKELGVNISGTLTKSMSGNTPTKRHSRP
jgi:hypothetical protein